AVTGEVEGFDVNDEAARWRQRRWLGWSLWRGFTRQQGLAIALDLLLQGAGVGWGLGESAWRERSQQHHEPVCIASK
ncbi:MAG: hypothetical protein ACOYNZ_04285, partial [Rhodoferax sp.]